MGLTRCAVGADASKVQRQRELVRAQLVKGLLPAQEGSGFKEDDRDFTNFEAQTRGNVPLGGDFLLRRGFVQRER